VANTRAIEIAGITKDTPQPAGGVIHRDKESGEPNGILEEGPAFFLVYGHVPQPTLEQSLDGVNEGARMYAQAGVTTAQDGSADKATIDILQEAIRRDMMPIRINVYPNADVTESIINGRFFIESGESDMLRIGATKIVADGSIQGYTGYLREPYHKPYKGDETYRGYPRMPREKLTELVTRLYKNNHQIAVHGNGDAAIDDILYAIAEAQKEYPGTDARPIIIHSQMAQEDQLDRMKELGVIPSFFSLHTYYWGDRHSAIFMGPERAARMSPAQSALARKLPFTIHCDTPVVPMEPLKLVWATVNRISTGGVIIGEEQRISVMDALRATTINAAYQNFEEDVKGSIEVGKYADLVILSEDPRLYPTRIKDIEILETIVGDRSVYRKGNDQ
jgi:predicted amidohydrolase YtcJ